MLKELPQYAFARATGRIPPLPSTYTFIVQGTCNSRCLTCGIRNQRIAPDLTLDEWRRTFDSLGRIFWATLSGGEPFMRADLPALHDALVSVCHPRIVNIPTNSLARGKDGNRYTDFVWEMAQAHQDTKLVINISIDHSDPAKNDVIRGVPGHYKRAIANLAALKALGLPNLTVGIHTVISRYNVADFPQIAAAFLELSPDQFICEVAEERVELHTEHAGITPSAEQYAEAVRGLRDAMRRSNAYKGLGRVTRAFRLNYYQNTIKYLETHQQPIPCYAGYASAQINYDGQVWPCCVEAVPLGNLREHNYDFGTIWRSGLAKQARERIRTGGCSCPLGNASYSNMLLSPVSLAKVAANLL